MNRSVSPTSLEEAVRRLADDPDLVPVAGCTDLMVGDPVDRAALGAVMNVMTIPELQGIRDAGGGAEIGAATSFAAIGRSPLIRDRFPALHEAARVIGGWQIQNRATLGGNMANASPAGDSLPVLLALDTRVTVAGPDGTREIPYEEFHTGYRTTALRRGELIAWVRLPAPPEPSFQRFRKVGTRRAQAISKVVLAMCAGVSGGNLSSVRIAAGSVAPTPVRLGAAEAVCEGRAPDAKLAEEAARAAAEEVTPIDDVRSTAGYRRFVLSRLIRRFVLEAGG